MRYFVYEGNVPATAWLNLAFAGVGVTDGGLLRTLTLYQDADGIGPNFALEIEHGFWRDRLVIWAEARGAFVLQSVSAESAPFFALVREETTNTLVPVESHLTETLDKSSWHTGVEFGFSVMLVEDLYINFAGMLHAFHDAVLLPSDIAIPQNPGQAIQGTDGVFNTHDLRYEGFYVGLDFQF